MVLHQDCQFGAVTINGVSLAPGTYTYNNLLAQFPRNFARGVGQHHGGSPSVGLGFSATTSSHVAGDLRGLRWRLRQQCGHKPGDSLAALSRRCGRNRRRGLHAIESRRHGMLQRRRAVCLYGSVHRACVTPGIQVYWNGTSGAPITYASTNTWGDGSRAIFTDNYARTLRGILELLRGEQPRVQQPRNRADGRRRGLPVDTGDERWPANPAWGMYFTERGQRNDRELLFPQPRLLVQPATDEFGLDPGRLHLLRGHYLPGRRERLEVTNCEFTRCNGRGDPVRGQPATWPWRVVTSTITSCGPSTWPPHGGSGIGLNNVFISANQFHDFDWAYAPFYWAGYGGPPHHDGIYLRPAISGRREQYRHLPNMFWGTHTNASGTAAIWAASSSANIYNNLIINCNSLANGDYSGRCPSTVRREPIAFEIPSLMRVLNNTIIVNTAANLDNGQSTEALYMGCDGSETWPLNDTLIVENNIFYDFRTTIYGTDLVGTDPIARDQRVDVQLQRLLHGIARAVSNLGFELGFEPRRSAGDRVGEQRTDRRSTIRQPGVWQRHELLAE